MGSNKISKYGNKKAIRGNITFDSQKEANRFDELMLMLRAGIIKDLRLQPEFTLQESFTTPQGEKIRAIKYRADFQYIRDGVTVVEDVKGYKTKDYELKRKLMAGKGIIVQEI